MLREEKSLLPQKKTLNLHSKWTDHVTPVRHDWRSVNAKEEHFQISLKTFCNIWAVFRNVGVFYYQFLIALAKFCTILGVMEPQLMNPQFATDPHPHTLRQEFCIRSGWCHAKLTYNMIQQNESSRFFFFFFKLISLYFHAEQCGWIHSQLSAPTHGNQRSAFV